MASERLKLQVDRLLDEADQAITSEDWSTVGSRARSILAIDPENSEGIAYLAAAERAQANSLPPLPQPREPPRTAPDQPYSFVDGRYQVKRFLGEGGKKKVYLAQDTTLDRDVAFALIKTEGLDDTSRTRIQREAQAMGRLGSHPHIVTVFDLGHEQDQPYMVTELMGGGDVESLIEEADNHLLPLERTLKIAVETCQGLEFAHSQGIVHRDLKPGNVWLTENGTAKIGDFGLAVALDKSRLTSEGMMVGTVSYMPPEQALGGDVTAQADLYSLGAMLYEMVTGRPPFLGDDPVAIIGQHLNTPPVAPSWHVPGLPAGLEALVLRLLEKDPSKRPVSATEVRQALESVQLTAARPESVEASGVDTRPQGPDPVYGRTFVGREAELKKLERAFDAAVSGNGFLIMVVGEPGIGKTSLCEQLATYVAMRGGKTLVGHCYEEGSLSLPYLAFVEALRSYVLSREPDALKEELGTGAGDVARIVSEIRDTVQVDLSPPGDPEEDRYRLLQAVTGFLRNASSVQPLLVVLEDLHDADRGTLDLLTHLSRQLSGSRLLIIGTYRDVEVDRVHPLSTSLAELRRGGNFDRIPLRGLSPDEVQRMVNTIQGEDLAGWDFSETVHRQTEGNPLFVQEVLRYFVEEGLLERRGGQLRSAREEPLASKVPEGIKDVIGRRLSRLSQEANEVLSIAAVIGREFRLDVLEKVATLPQEQVLEALEQSCSAAIIEERSRVGREVSFWFNHAFFRQTLYEEIFAPRRIRLHQQVGRVLEETYGRRLEEHAAELAEHFAQSTDVADLGKAVHHGEVAAQRAMSVYAYGEAVHHLEQALNAQEVLDLDDKAKRCTLLLALAAALMPAGEPLRAVEEPVEKAFQIAEELADSGLMAKTFALAVDGLTRGLEGTSIVPHPKLGHWAERADRHVQPGTPDRVNADLMLIHLLASQGRWREANARAINALEVARSLKDQVSVLRIAAAVKAHLPTWLIEQCISLAEEIEPFRSSQNPRLYVACVGSLVPLYAAAGDPAKSQALRKELEDFQAESQDPFATLWLMECEVQEAILAGRMESALEAVARLAERSGELGSPERGRFLGVFAAYVPLVHLGRADEFLDGCANSLEEEERKAPLVWSRIIGCLAQLGRIAEAQESLDEYVKRFSLFDGDAPALLLSDLLEAAVLLADESLVRRLSDLLANTKFMVVPSDREIRCLGRHLGRAFALRGEADEARAYYDRTLEVCNSIGFQPEIALTRLDLTELLFGHFPDERDAASEFLNLAIADFRQMGMQPSLERALRHRGLLEA